MTVIVMSFSRLSWNLISRIATSRDQAFSPDLLAKKPPRPGRIHLKQHLYQLQISNLSHKYCEPVGSRTPIEGTGILYSIH